MALAVQCPHCEASFRLAESTRGKRLRCTNCDKIFTVEDASPLRSGEPRKYRSGPRNSEDDEPPMVLPAEASGAGRRRYEEEDDDLPLRPRRRRPETQATFLPWIIAGVAGALLLLVIAGVSLAWLLSRGEAVAARTEATQENPQRPAPAAPVAAAGEEGAPPGLYGDQGGEECLPADPGKPDTILRCRASDSFFLLSNPHTGNDRFGRPTLFIDYEKTRVGQGGFTLVIHSGDGSRHNVLLMGPMNQTRGTLEISTMFGGFGRPAFAKNMEAYLTHSDPRYGPNTPHFKVSNSITLGTMPTMTRPRNWTREEIDRLTKPPPNYTNANGHPNVGADTPFAGDTTGGGSFRYVEPAGLLLGAEYRPGEWDKEKCIGGLVPVFSRDQPPTGQTRILARDGYAVGGFKVQSRRYVDAIQIIFLRIAADGRLNPADSYTSDWFGFPGQEPAKTLAGDGRKVIGIHCRQGAILNGIALVLERQGDKIGP
ncbi:MAG TPA: zinc-ribbon domain-containing protein [Gemmataceae bacterium]|nr:zinc-ribbon domain-containing protein [Gemmataceae bacterium]